MGKRRWIRGTTWDFGFFDFVPTKIVITSELKTASDDWFSDFSQTGYATGRLPARTAADAQTMVAKITGYAGGQNGSWTNQSLFVADLTNGDKLPVFFLMNCLNGFFHDVYTESLAQALMLARTGGAVAVWASSGLTIPDPQFQMDQTVVKTLFSQPGIRLGDAISVAKSGISDPDVLKTFILFGDPLTRLKSGQPGTTGLNRSLTNLPGSKAPCFRSDYRSRQL